MNTECVNLMLELEHQCADPINYFLSLYKLALAITTGELERVPIHIWVAVSALCGFVSNIKKVLQNVTRMSSYLPRIMAWSDKPPTAT